MRANNDRRTDYRITSIYPTPMFLQAVFCSLRHTFTAYIIDVYNGTAVSLESLQASAIPEAAGGTAAHINLTGVTELHWKPLSFHTVYFPLFSSLYTFRSDHPYHWFLSWNTSAMSHPTLIDSKHTRANRRVFMQCNSIQKRITDICT